MGDVVLLLVRHLSEGLLRSARLEPGIPSEVPFAAWLDQDFSLADAAEDLDSGPVPVADAAFRFGGPVVERVGDGGQTLASGRFEQPFDVGTWKVAELVEAQRYVFDDEPAVALCPCRLQFIAGDLFDAGSLNLRQDDGDSEQRDAEDAFGFDAFVGVRRDENQLVE